MNIYTSVHISILRVFYFYLINSLSQPFIFSVPPQPQRLLPLRYNLIVLQRQKLMCHSASAMSAIHLVY